MIDDREKRQAIEGDKKCAVQGAGRSEGGQQRPQQSLVGVNKTCADAFPGKAGSAGQVRREIERDASIRYNKAACGRCGVLQAPLDLSIPAAAHKAVHEVSSPRPINTFPGLSYSNPTLPVSF